MPLRCQVVVPVGVIVVLYGCPAAGGGPIPGAGMGEPLAAGGGQGFVGVVQPVKASASKVAAPSACTERSRSGL